MTDTNASTASTANADTSNAAAATASKDADNAAPEVDDEGLKPTIIKLRMPVRLDSGEMISELRGETVILGKDLEDVAKQSNEEQFLRVALKRFNISRAVTGRMYAGDYNAMIDAVVAHIRPMGK